MVAKRVRDFAEGVTDILGAIASIPIIGRIFGAMTDSAGTHIEKRASELFGLSSTSAEKNDDDEISFRKVLVKGVLLNDAQKQQIKEWIGRLRMSDPKLASEFTRRIHNILVKTTKQSEVESGTKDKPKKKTSTDESDAIRIAEDLVLDIVSATDDAERLRILARENIKVVASKTAPAVDATKKFFKEKIAEGEKANRKDFNETTANWAERAKAWRENR